MWANRRFVNTFYFLICFFYKWFNKVFDKPCEKLPDRIWNVGASYLLIKTFFLPSKFQSDLFKLKIWLRSLVVKMMVMDLLMAYQISDWIIVTGNR